MKGKMRTLPKNLEPKEKEKADKKIYFKTSGPVKGKTFNYQVFEKEKKKQRKEKILRKQCEKTSKY